MPKGYIPVRVLCPVHNQQTTVYFIRGPVKDMLFFNGCETYSCNYKECSTLCRENAKSKLSSPPPSF